MSTTPLDPDPPPPPAPAPNPPVDDLPDATPPPGTDTAQWKTLQGLLADEREHMLSLHDEKSRKVNPQGTPIGLALSGGGIRSATFSLGVVQALAQRGFLRRIDYLSTVSGGGYIGAWLSACIHHEQVAGSADPVGEVEKRIRPSQIRKEGEEPNELRFLRAYSNYLTPRLGAFSGDTLAAAAGFFRNLALNLVVGVASAGLILAVLHLGIAGLHLGLRSGAVAGIGWVAGMLLLLAMGGTAMLLTLQSYDIRAVLEEAQATQTAQQSMQLAQAALLAAQQSGSLQASQLMVIAAAALDLAKRVGQGELILGFFVKLQLVSSRWMGPLLGVVLVLGSVWLGASPEAVGTLEVTGAALMLLSAFALGSFYGLMLLEVPRLDLSAMPSGSAWAMTRHLLELLGLRAGLSAWKIRSDIPRYVLACLVSACAAYWLLGLGSDLRMVFRAGPGVSIQETLDLIVFGPLVVTAVVWMLYLLWMGTVGNSYSEFTREWLSRVVGGLSGVATGWFVTGVLIVHATPAWQWSLRQTDLLMRGHGLALASGTATALVLLALALKRLRTKERSPQSAPPADQFPLVNIASLLAVVGVIAVMTIAFQAGLTRLATGVALPLPAADATYGDVLATHLQALERAFRVVPAELSLAALFTPTLALANWARFLPVLTLVGLFALLACIAFWAVDVNTFSLQNLYRNRLVRCYLGAAHHRDRLENPFAGFDPKDDLELRVFAQQRPYLLASAALNITQGADLAWQQRMAASFLFSPLWCGFWLESTEGSRIVTSERVRGGYVRTENFVNEPAGFRKMSHGVMVGTAIATSGAAVSSQMGFASRGALAFLLTLLNVRLGRWLPNPALQGDADRWRRNSPPFGAFWYLRELLGITNERSSWVYASDGGHFENTGLYELVRRRCALIVSVDAGADPFGGFGDLGNAVRKCRIDFGVDIHIDTERLRVDPLTGRSAHGCAIGTIDYPQGPGSEPRFQGRIIYIKPVLPKSLKASAAAGGGRQSDLIPADIVSYRKRNPEFPHQPTFDQWFTESQFESYRQLGYLLGIHALKEGQRYFDDIATPRGPAPARAGAPAVGP